MSELIEPILFNFRKLLQAAGATGSDPAFGDVLIGPSTGVLMNPPGAWIIPVKTQFPDQGEGNMRNEIHLVTVRLAITGAAPEELTLRTARYVRAVDYAINAYQGWEDFVLRAWVMEHDYGPMYKLNNLAFWPDLHCQVEVEEVS